MDDTPHEYAYRCLPLSMANSHGWTIGCPTSFSAEWDGGRGREAVSFVFEHGDHFRPVSLFGSGIVTFHVHGIIRTPPGWNLWLSGVPNEFKDGIQAMSGVIETDWSPYTFTMNWQFTRAHHPVHFIRDEPIAFFFPVQRGCVERFRPRTREMREDRHTSEGFAEWSASRDAFHAEVARNPPTDQKNAWQRHYMKGIMPDGARAPQHETKVRPRPFSGVGQP